MSTFSPRSPENVGASTARRLLLVALCALIQGCVGGGVAWTEKETCQNPNLEGFHGEGKPHSYGAAETNITAFTPAWLRTNWGEPTSLRRTGPSGTNEIWTYKDDLNWNGVMLFVIIPIPLELPLGREWTELEIQEGRVIRWTRRSTRTAGGIVGYTVGPCGLNGFGPHSLSE